MTDLEAAWAAVRDNMPACWYVGRPGHEEWYDQWSMYAFDPSETLRRRQALAGVGPRWGRPSRPASHT